METTGTASQQAGAALLDQTGLAQKGGAVLSDVRFTRSATPSSNKIGDGECDVYLGYDVLVATDQTYLSVVSPERTTAVINTALVPTGHTVSAMNLENVERYRAQKDAPLAEFDAARAVLTEEPLKGPAARLTGNRPAALRRRTPGV